MGRMQLGPCATSYTFNEDEWFMWFHSVSAFRCHAPCPSFGALPPLCGIEGVNSSRRFLRFRHQFRVVTVVLLSRACERKNLVVTCPLYRTVFCRRNVRYSLSSWDSAFVVQIAKADLVHVILLFFELTSESVPARYARTCLLTQVPLSAAAQARVAALPDLSFMLSSRIKFPMVLALVSPDQDSE